MKKEDKKKLPFNKQTIRNLDDTQGPVLGSDEMGDVNGGSENTPPLYVGVTSHPKYCW